MATAVIPFNPRQNSLYMKSCYSVCKEKLNWFNEIQITWRRNKGVGTLDGQDFDTTLNKRTGNLCKLSGIVGQQGAWNYLHYTCNSLVGAEAIKLVVTKYFVKMSTPLLPWCLPVTRIWCIYIYIHCWWKEGFVRVNGTSLWRTLPCTQGVLFGCQLGWSPLIFVSIAFILHFYYFTKFMKDSNIPISNSTCHLF